MAENKRNHVSALILGAGEGLRLGGRPKALIELAGETLVERAIKTARQVASQIIVGVRPASVNQVREMLDCECEVVAGGETRQQTAELLLARARNRIVLFHDVARPLASSKLFQAVVKLAAIHGGATPAIRATLRDSIALANGDWLGSALPRDKVILTQTPYAFKRKFVIRAMNQASKEGWHDTTITALLTRASFPIRLVEGESSNIKITYPEDLVAALELLSRR